MTEPYEYAVGDAAQADFELDYRPLVRQIVDEISHGVAPAAISRRFHSTLVHVIASLCGRLREAHALNTVVLTGGVFLNEFLLVNTLVELRRMGFDVHAHRNVPTNDGGIALGQAVVASARMAGPSEFIE